MNALTEPQPGSSSLSDPITTATRNLIDPSELQSILTNLGQEFGRQLLSLRAGFDILLGDAAPPISNDQREHVYVMVGLCDDLLRLTKNYVDYAGLVQGSQPPCLGKFSLGGFVREVDRIHGPHVVEEGRPWTCKLDGPDGVVTTDASFCLQVFSILVGNALKYTPSRTEINVNVRIEGETWRILVRDDGPGIPADDLERVFEPFYRLPRDERAKVSGDGLGLAICREMVERLGGEIVLKSELGRGTEVIARFPVDLTKTGLARDPKPSRTVGVGLD